MQILRVLSRALPVRKRPTTSVPQQIVLAGRANVSRDRRARGVALLVCIFVMLIVSSLVIFALNMDATEMAITRNTLDLSRALYLADAGIQHALGMVRADRSWRAGFGSPGVEFPPGSGAYYVVTVTDGASGEVIVTSTGDTGGLSKTVRATIAVP
ncbi:MAG: hypothetical protein IH987_01730 [Planctomycetes bacterium]|nr:hypothetical protein [Planctomycetota bacterium]